MANKGVLVLSLLLCLNLVEGMRVKEDVFNHQKEEEGQTGKFASTSGKCKRWCKTQAVAFPIDLDRLKEQANAKCHTDKGMRDCKGCEGGGMTVPDCREKEMPQEETVVDAVVGAVADETVDVPACATGGDYSTQVCRFHEGEICSHITAAWCPAPSRNAGHSFRSGRMPLCCSDEGDSEMDETSLAEEVKAVADALKEDTSDQPEPKLPVPVCDVGHTFTVSSLQRGGKTVNMCRDGDTGTFAKKVCCDANTFKLLEDQQKAEEVCLTVQNKYCKPNANVFNGKRKKYPDMPSTFSCKRMYMCIAKGEESFGPVPNQSWCDKSKTGLEKNRPATTTCVPVKKDE